MTRDERLKWAKDRAAVYLDRGNAREAWASFCSDMMNHPETKDHPALQLGTMLHFAGKMSTVAEVRDFIKGFN